MDSRLLHSFIEIVESGNMTAASRKLFIAQPVLSNQLRATSAPKTFWRWKALQSRKRATASLASAVRCGWG